MKDLDPASLEILKRRAEKLALPPPRDELEAGELCAVFSMGDELFAFPLAAMRATIPLKLVTPVPLAPPFVLGVVRYERSIVAVLSLPAMLGDRAWRRDPTVLLVLEVEAGRVLAVDCAEIPVSVPLAPAAEPETGATTRRTLADGRAVTMIDVGKLAERTRRHAS